MDKAFLVYIWSGGIFEYSGCRYVVEYLSCLKELESMRVSRKCFYVLVLIVTLVLTSGYRGYGGKISNDEPVDEQPLLEYDIPLPEGSFELVDANGLAYTVIRRNLQHDYPDTFVSRNGLRWSLKNTEFNTEFPEDFELIVNGNSILTENLIIEEHLLTASITLADGRNDVSLKAYDKVGRSLYYDAILWAGDNTVTVSLVNSDGTLFTTETNVVASVADDTTIAARVVTSNAIATLVNIPDRTILINAQSINNDIGSIGITGAQNSVKIIMRGFNPPSPTKNLDFSEGTGGWVISPDTPVKIVPHIEEISGFPRK